jgi:hypothetical protein
MIYEKKMSLSLKITFDDKIQVKRDSVQRLV